MPIFLVAIAAASVVKHLRARNSCEEGATDNEAGTKVASEEIAIKPCSSNTSEDEQTVIENECVYFQIPSEDDEPDPSISELPPNNTIRAILSAPINYADAAEERACKQIVDEMLTMGEIEEAAMFSYAYFVSKTFANERVFCGTGSFACAPEENSDAPILVTNCEGFERELQPPGSEEQRQMALKTVRRYVATTPDVTTAVDTLRQSIKFRREININVVRRCFHLPYDSAAEGELCRMARDYRKRIQVELEQQNMIVRGHDREGRAILVHCKGKPTIGVQCNGEDTLCEEKIIGIGAESDNRKGLIDCESYLLAHIYAIERALATTEVSSLGREDRIVIAMSFKGFVPHVLPPIRSQKEIMSKLQIGYPEIVEKFVAIDPPIFVRACWNFLKQFINPEILKRICFVTKKEGMTKIFGDAVEREYSIPTQLPGEELTELIDIEKYLHGVPYHSFC